MQSYFKSYKVQTKTVLNSTEVRTLFYSSNANTKYVMKSKLSVGIQTCHFQFSVRKAFLCVCNVYGMDGGAVAKQ